MFGRQILYLCFHILQVKKNHICGKIKYMLVYILNWYIVVSEQGQETVVCAMHTGKHMVRV